ncbi:MAG TPA: serine protease [Pyrinomonadaceae bacterium]
MQRLSSLLIFLSLLAFAPNGAAHADAEHKRDNASRATVRIMAGELDGAGVFHSRAVASGVFITGDGHILTARHAVFAGNGPADLYPEVWATLPDPRRESALPNRAVRLSFVAADPKADLALFQIRPAARHKAQRYPFLRLAVGPDLAYGDTLRVVGYAGADDPQGSGVTVSVVEPDEGSDWLKVNGDLLLDLTGAAVVNERRELVGIQISVKPQTVTLLDENNTPAGRIQLERVGMLRPAAVIARFLGQALRETFPQSGELMLKVDALVLDERTRRPVVGATIGLLKKGTASPEFYVAADELLSYGRSDAVGECVLSRGVAPGLYVVKVVHPDYETEIKEVSVTQKTGRLVIKMQSAIK